MRPHADTLHPTKVQMLACLCLPFPFVRRNRKREDKGNTIITKPTSSPPHPLHSEPSRALVLQRPVAVVQRAGAKWFLPDLVALEYLSEWKNKAIKGVNPR